MTKLTEAALESFAIALLEESRGLKKFLKLAVLDTVRSDVFELYKQ